MNQHPPAQSCNELLVLMLAKTKLHYKQDEPPLQQMSDQSKPQEGEGEDNRITLDNQS